MKNLLGRLMSRPLDELRAIAAVWGTLTRDVTPSQNDLAIATYHTLTDPSAMRSTWERLDTEERAFLARLMAQRNMLAILDDVPALIDRPLDETSALIDRLRVLGLVDVDEVMVRGSRVVSSGDNLYAWASRGSTEAVPRRVVSIATEAAKVLREVMEESKRPPPFDEPFHTLLERYEQADIQRIASIWKLPDAGRYYKSELIGIMSEFLATGQGKGLLLSTLSPAAQSLYTFLEAQGGRATAAAVKENFGWGEREIRAASTGLLQRALVWDTLDGDRRTLFIPRDLLKGSNGAAPRIGPHMQPKLDAPEPYSTSSRFSYELAWDLLSLLSEASRGELALTLQDTRITKRLARRINSGFLQPEDLKTGTTSEYVDAVVHLARAAGLLVERPGDQPALLLAPRLSEWVRLTFEAQRRRLFNLWLEDRKWAEPATYGTIYWWNADLTGARKRLVRHIQELPAGKWISLEGFLKKVHLTEPFIIWGQDELVRRYGLRALQGFRSQWFEIEGRIVADMLRTMLHWLGVVDLGRDKQKRLLSFRVTPAAQSLLTPEQAATSAAPAGSKGSSASMLVQPNFEVLVLQPDSRALWTLMLMADLVRHDRVSVYSITKESVLRAVENGMGAREMVSFLAENVGKSLPQNVAQSISDWARLVKNTLVQRATLIEVDDPAVLDELIASRKTRKYISRRLTPTVAIAELQGVGDSGRDDPWQRLMKELRAAGYLPRFTSELIKSEEAPAKEAHVAGPGQSGQAPAGQEAAAVSRTDTVSAAGRRRRASSRSSA